MKESPTPPGGPPDLPGHRRRVTRPRVRLVDRAAAVLITLGGVSVILAVLGILAYLALVVAPLFEDATLVQEASYALVPPDLAGRVLFAEVDEYRALGIAALSTGEAIAFSAGDGAIVDRWRLFEEAPVVTAFCRQADGSVAFGFSDGTVRLGRVGWSTRFGSRPVEQPGSAVAAVPAPPGVTQILADGSRRRITAAATIGAPIAVGHPGIEVVRIDYRPGDQASRLAVVQADRAISLLEITRRKNLLTGSETAEAASRPIDYPAGLGFHDLPAFVLLTSIGDQLYLAWSEGTTLRYDLREQASPRVVERADLAPEEGARLTALRFVTGEQSLLVGDSRGSVSAWFRVAHAGGEEGDRLVPAHRLAPLQKAVTALAVSQRDRTVVAASAVGELAVSYLTSERRLVDVTVQPTAEVRSAQITPKADGLFAVTADGRATMWALDSPHPQTSLSALFGRIWYDGYPQPAWTWQSSSGTDDFEPKLSLTPLLFGTLKATFYSMIFAAPIALCAALYTSEFLDARYRSLIKSSIEMMASLPSVVLGFIAALVLAPLFETWVTAVLAALAIMPLTALAMGYLCQAAPPRLARLANGRLQILLLVVGLILGLILARGLAGPLETLIFDGDFQGWLDGRTGTGAPGVGLLAWPFVFVAVVLLDRRMPRRGGANAALTEVGRYLVILPLSFALAGLAGVAGGSLGLDPRPGLMGTYTQRNAMVVGFVMGFAVIPIVYTIAEDALSSVPRALRSASLGCGATRWQTATRVVLPVALPGLFSALMVGLGRAVGETMIVLMAAGNTPIMDFNVFSGLRTLSANIAVELPEAARGGTLYRTLFLAALLLFALTFALNMLAEIIRQRFRWKSLS